MQKKPRHLNILRFLTSKSYKCTYKVVYIPLLLAHNSFMSSPETVEAVLPSLRWPKLPDFLTVLLGRAALGDCCFLF